MENTNEEILHDKEQYYTEAFSRNLFDAETQKKVRQGTVALAGLGAVGGTYAVALARLGVEGFHISDLDTFNVVNMNRQLGATVDSLGKSKTEITEKIIHSINPFARVQRFEGGLSEENIDAFLDGASVVLDSMDFFNIKIRRLVYTKAYEKGLYVIGAAPIGYGSALLAIAPDGMSFDEYFDIQDGMSENEMLLRFVMGLAPAALHRSYFTPQSVQFKQKKAKSLMTGVLLCGNLVTCEVVKLLKGEKVAAVPHTSQFDPYVQKYKKVTLTRGNRGLVQKLKINIARKQFTKLGFFDENS